MSWQAILLAAATLAAEYNVPLRMATPPFPAQRRFIDTGNFLLTRLGTAHRERLGMSMYTVALYADLRAVKQRTRAGQRSHDRIAALLREGELPVALVFRYEQGISADRRKEFNQLALEQCWPSQDFHPDHPGYRAFESHFKDPILRGGEFQVWIQRGVMSLRTSGGPVDRVVYPDLCRAFLACYLSETNLPGETRTLRDELLQDLGKRLESP